MEKRGIKEWERMSFAPAELYVLAGAAGVTDIFDCQTVTQLFYLMQNVSRKQLRV